MIWVEFAVSAIVIVVVGVRLARYGDILGEKTGLGEAFVGSLFIAVTTSLPEVVVSLAAVRMGAIDLGVGIVLGSNLFNLLILGLDDAFYRQGSLLVDAGPAHAVALLAVVAMNGIFLIGLTRRVITKRFVIAWDTAAIGVTYALASALIYRMRG